MQIDPVTISEKNSKHQVASASVASIVDEMPEADLDYGGLTSNEKPKQQFSDSTNFFTVQKIQKPTPAAITSHSAMNNNGLMKPSKLNKGEPPKGIGVKR